MVGPQVGPALLAELVADQHGPAPGVVALENLPLARVRVSHHGEARCRRGAGGPIRSGPHVRPTRAPLDVAPGVLHDVPLDPAGPVPAERVGGEERHGPGERGRTPAVVVGGHEVDGHGHRGRADVGLGDDAGDGGAGVEVEELGEEPAEGPPARGRRGRLSVVSGGCADAFLVRRARPRPAGDGAEPGVDGRGPKEEEQRERQAP